MPKFRGEVDLTIDAPSLEQAEAVAETAVSLLVNVSRGLTADLAVIVEAKEDES